MSRMLGAKAALAIRVDALGEDGSFELGAAHKAKLESRLKLLEEGNFRRISGTGKAKAKFEKYYGVSEIKEYPATADNTMASSSKRKHFDEIKKEEEDMEDVKPELTPKQLKKKLKKEKKILESNEIKTEIKEEEPEAEVTHKKKKKGKSESEETTTDTSGETEEVNTEKKEKKKKSKEVVEVEYE